jgi:HEAT repeat protein
MGTGRVWKKLKVQVERTLQPAKATAVTKGVQESLDRVVKEVASEGQRWTRIKPATRVPPLIESLKDKDVSVRREAAEALGEIGPEAEDAVSPLLDLLRDENEMVQMRAKKALKRINPKYGD